MIHLDQSHHYSFIGRFCTVFPIAHFWKKELQFHIQSDSLDCGFLTNKAEKRVYFSESKVTYEKCDSKRYFLFEVDSDEGQFGGSRWYPKVHS